MLTWLRRLFVVLPAIRDLRERVATVESDLEFLALELKKLRGRVTGGIRHAQDPPGPTNGDQPLPTDPPWLARMDPISRKIWRNRLALGVKL